MAIENKILTFGTGKVGTVGGNKLMGYNKYFLANQFITVANITDPTQITAINYLVKELVDNDLINKFHAIYPFVGGDATKHSYNLIDTSVFQLVFNGGWVHSVNGALPNGVNSYANTYYNPVTNGLAYNNNHLSYYSRTSAQGGTYDIGSGNSTVGGTSLFLRRAAGTNSAYDSGDITNRISTTVATGAGYFMGSSILTNIGYYYRNGVQLATKNPLTNVSMKSYNIYIGGFNEQDTNTYYGTRECAFASMGIGLSTSEISLMYTIVQQFQTILSRNV